MKATHLIRLNKSDVKVELDWSIGYEGLKFNCYRNSPDGDWVYESSDGLSFMRPALCTECGDAHEVAFISNALLYCLTCKEQLDISEYKPRFQQEVIRKFLMLHGTPEDWDFETYVLRQERRYHYSDYAKMCEPDASALGIKIMGTKLSDGTIVVTDDEGGTWTRQSHDATLTL